MYGKMFDIALKKDPLMIYADFINQSQQWT